MLNVVKLLRRQ